ncbi:MAG TPA: hypothetical protein VI197_21535, partial [Polyangiaceae bacterium]
MESSLFGLFVLWLLSGCRRGATGTEYEPAVPSGPGWPAEPIALPAGGGVAPSWPVSTATGPRPFPGPAWEFDEPPPAAV